MTGGQGIASGFRDASALAWRLALLHRQPNLDHERILTAWYTERKQQLQRSLAATLRNGEYITESAPFKVFIREWLMWAAQLIPRWKRGIELGQRAEGMIRYRGAPGLPFIPGMHGGLNIPQVYAFNLKTNEVNFTDDLIFSPGKRGLLQLLLLPETTNELRLLLKQVEEVDESSQGFIKADEVTVLVQTTDPGFKLDDKNTDTKNLVVARLATGDEFLEDSTLCINRPPPVGYDAWRLWREVGRKKFVIIRPDRFTYAAGSSKDELALAIKQIPGALSMRSCLVR